jgi:alpha-ribazole phosphatase
MLELYLLRHGQTAMSRENRFCGSIDPPLSDDGRLMAEAFAVAHADAPWQAIYCSPMSRTRATAAPLVERVGLEPIIDDGLREISYGEWESLTHDEASQRFPKAYAYWEADTASRGTPGGETAFEVAARAARVLERIRREQSTGRVLVVSHKATIRIITCALLGLDVRLFRERIGQPVAAITRFELSDKGALLTRLGDVSHLPPALRYLEGT